MGFSVGGNLRNCEEARRCGHVGFCVIPDPLRIKLALEPWGVQARTKGFVQQELAEIHDMRLWFIGCKM